MHRKILHISALIISSLLPFGVFATCSIESSLSEGLSNYQNMIRAELRDISKDTKNQCGPTTNGGIANATRFLELYDIAMLKFPLYNDIATDFRYTLSLSLGGETKYAVTRNGQIFRQMQSLIDGTVTVLGQNCSLNDAKETRIINLIRLNASLESLYKNITIGAGAAVQRSDIPEAYRVVYDDIITNYNPSATSECKSNTDNLSKKMEEDLTNFTNGSFGIENAWYNWQEAMALFSGTSKRGKSYYEAQKRRLLEQELSRQGLSKNAKDVILKNLNCVQGEQQNNDSLESEVQAIAKCKSNVFIGIDKLKSKLDNLTADSPTRTVYIDKVNSSKTYLNDAINIASLYQDLVGRASKQVDINDTMMRALIDMHIRLRSLNTIVEKGAKDMLGSCQKALTNIPCPN